ncbi:hypothetical protein DUNSADRAFT_14377 [Dunaliella salina]|uniref:Uncharacterized protein n=1 Tax=Dunaliella salina TaxID=3046 RepID=A0ABQ7G7G8_DUNSA|nr:hypothetical protein DUNSADRAFT_14377 [Dunaliella salina]|eukprot:KAF5830526.1 hypothetical protein DUNSADRAFT_14377 [Dunaliella salina]
MVQGSERGTRTAAELEALLQGTTPRNLRRAKLPIRELLAACCSPALNVDHGRATLLMELLCHREMDEASPDPMYQALLWNKNHPLGSRVKRLVDGFCGQRSHHGLLEDLLLHEYHHHSHHERDPLLNDLLKGEGQLFHKYDEEVGKRWQRVMEGKVGEYQGSGGSSMGEEASTSASTSEGVRTHIKQYRAPGYVPPSRRGTHHQDVPKVEGEGRESGWVNTRYHMANQLQQNLEVHVRGALLTRVREYLHSVQLPGGDEGAWGSHRDQLFKMVVHGRVDDRMSVELKTCLQDLRETLQPYPHFTGSLPRRITRPLEDLLPLHLFLTRHSRPRATSFRVPTPDEEEKPGDMEHAAAATGVSEKLAFQVSKRAQQRRRREQAGQAVPPTQATTCSYCPIAGFNRQFAPLCGNILMDMVPLWRLENALARGGSRSSGPTFRAYSAKEAEHWYTMFEDFVLDPKRAKAGMARY